MQIDRHQHLANGFGAHASVEFVTILLECVEIHFVCQQLATLELGQTGLDDNECLEVQHALDFAQGHVEHSGTRYVRPGSQARYAPCAHDELSSA